MWALIISNLFVLSLLFIEFHFAERIHILTCETRALQGGEKLERDWNMSAAAISGVYKYTNLCRKRRWLGTITKVSALLEYILSSGDCLPNDIILFSDAADVIQMLSLLTDSYRCSMSLVKNGLFCSALSSRVG